MQLTIQSLKEENNELKNKLVDSSEFEQWDYNQVINWIFSIENGLFKQNYGDVLKQEIILSELCGKDLISLNINDMKAFKINKFSDRKLLQNHIQNLTKSKNEPPNKDLKPQISVIVIYNGNKKRVNLKKINNDYNIKSLIEKIQIKHAKNGLNGIFAVETDDGKSLKTDNDIINILHDHTGALNVKEITI